jgi:hypothetical protein
MSSSIVKVCKDTHIVKTLAKSLYSHNERVIYIEL